MMSKSAVLILSFTELYNIKCGPNCLLCCPEQAALVEVLWPFPSLPFSFLFHSHIPKIILLGLCQSKAVLLASNLNTRVS